MEKARAELKKIRLEKGITLEEAHKKTKIHLNILKAIEGDAVTGLNPIYLKSFIKIYCKYLGVEPDIYIPGSKEKQPVSSAPLAKSGPSGNEAKKPKPALSQGPQKAPMSIPKVNLKVIAYAAAAILFLFGLFSLGRFISSGLRSRPAPLKKAPLAAVPVKEKKAIAPPKVPVSAGIADKPLKSAIASEIRLSIFAREKCWIELKVDGKMVFRGRLEKGRSEAWKAKEKMELTLGDAGAVELQVNDQRFRNLGRKGQPRKNIIITKEGLR